MFKKLVFLLVAILILITVVTFSRIGLILPWYFTRSDRSTAGMDDSKPTQIDPSSTLSAPQDIGIPTSKASVPTTSIGMPAVLPTCFSPAEISPFAFTPDADKLLVRTRTGVQIFDLETGVLESFIHSSQDTIMAALSQDGKLLAWSLQDGTVQLVRLTDQKILANLIGHPDPVYDLLFSPSGDKLFSASHDGLVRIWNLSGKLVTSIEVGSEVMGIGLSSDGSKLAAIPSDGPVSLWDLAGNTQIREFGGSGGYDTSNAHFSPDGQYLASDLVTGIFLWRIADASLVWNDVKNSMAVTFSPDGKYMAYSNIDDNNTVFLASPDGSTTIRTFEGVHGPVWELFFSADSSLLAATDGFEIHVWRIQDGALSSIGKASCP